MQCFSCSGGAIPTTPYGAHLVANPSPRTRKNYKKQVQTISAARQETSQQEMYRMNRFRSQNPRDSESFRLKTAHQAKMKETMEKLSDPELRRSQHEENVAAMEARGIPVVGRDKRSFEEIMEEKYQKQGKSWKSCGEEISKKARLELERSRRSEETEVSGEEASKVLSGVVLLVARKLSSESPELHRIVERLGGTVSQSLDPSVTHFVFKGRPNDLTKEFRLAKQQACHIVSPDWVYFCRDEMERVEESTFPHTFNPKMKLNLSQDRSSFSVPRPRHVKAKLVLGEKIEEEEEKDETVADLDPPGGEVTEMETELENLNSLLGSIDSTPV